MINLKNFESNLLKIYKNPYKNIGIYNTGYITIKEIDDYECMYSVNPLYLQVDHANGYIEEKNGNKYLISWWFCRWKQRVTKKIQRCLEWNQKQNKR